MSLYRDGFLNGYFEKRADLINNGQPGNPVGNEHPAASVANRSTKEVDSKADGVPDMTVRRETVAPTNSEGPLKNRESTKGQAGIMGAGAAAVYNNRKALMG